MNNQEYKDKLIADENQISLDSSAKLNNYPKNNFFNLRNIYIFVIIFFIQLLTFHNFLQFHFSADCFTVLYKAFNYGQLSGQGRFLWSALSYFTDQIKLNLVLNQFYFTFLAILVNTLSIVFLTHLFLKDKVKSNFNLVISGLASTMVVSNLLTADLFQFAFMQIAYSLSLISVMVAIYFGVCKKFVLATIFLSISLAFYQAWTAIFLPIVLVINGFNKNNFIKSGLVFTFAWATNLGYAKLIHPLIFSWNETRIVGVNIFENLKTILDSFYFVWIDGYKVIPYYIGSILGLLTFFAVYQSTKKVVGGYRVFEQVISLFIIVNITAFLPHLASSEPWLSPRSVIGLFGFYGLMVVILLRFNNFQLQLDKGKVGFYTHLVSLGLLLLVGVNLIYINRLASDHIYVNRTDKDNVKIYLALIKKYQNDSGNQVKKMVYGLDDRPKWCLDEVICIRDLNVRNMTRMWAIPSMFRYYGIDLEFIPMDQQSKTSVFTKTNHDIPEYNQYLRFREDTAYILIP